MKLFLFILLLFSCSLASNDYPYENKLSESIHPYLHFAIPLASVCAVNYILVKAKPKNLIWKNVAISSALGISIGVGKELFDVSRGYKFGAEDMLIGVCGVLVAEGIYISFNTGRFF